MVTSNPNKKLASTSIAAVLPKSIAAFYLMGHRFRECLLFSLTAPLSRPLPLPSPGEE
jgi:hypothetical protein